MKLKTYIEKITKTVKKRPEEKRNSLVCEERGSS
jgi:hypothetical protein